MQEQICLIGGVVASRLLFNFVCFSHRWVQVDRRTLSGEQFVSRSSHSQNVSRAKQRLPGKSKRGGRHIYLFVDQSTANRRWISQAGCVSVGSVERRGCFWHLNVTSAAQKKIQILPIRRTDCTDLLKQWSKCWKRGGEKSEKTPHYSVCKTVQSSLWMWVQCIYTQNGSVWNDVMIKTIMELI